MIKNIIGGIAVGIANVIPGVSGGTMMVLLGIFDKVMEAIPGILHFKSPKWKEYAIFLLQVLVGVAVGLVGFAKILEVLFEILPIQTMYWFIGLIAFSIPVFMKSEMKGSKFYPISFVVGMAIVIVLQIMNPGDAINVDVVFPAITITHLLTMIVVGFIGGFTMFLPGVSGSMVLLIIGQYHLFKSYLANVTSFEMNILVPLAFMAIGVLIGIVVSAKVLKVALDKNKPATLSSLLGLIISSTLVLFYQTFGAPYDVTLVLTSLLAFLLGGAIVYILDRFVK